MQDWWGSESIQNIKNPWCIFFFFLLPPSLAVFADFFRTDVLFRHYIRRMFMRAGNSITSKVTQPVTTEKGSKDQTIKGMQGTGKVIPSGGRTNGLRWGEVVSPNFALIPEGHLPARTVHWFLLCVISAHWFLLCGEAQASLCFSSYPLQYIVILAVCIWIHPHFFLCLRTN